MLTNVLTGVVEVVVVVVVVVVIVVVGLVEVKSEIVGWMVVAVAKSLVMVTATMA